MASNEIITWLTETAKLPSSDDSENSWSDVCSISPVPSEQDSEDETDRLFFPLMRYLVRLRRQRIDDYLHIIDSWSDSEFKNRLRISRNTANTLIDELEASGVIASHKFGLKPLEPKLCFYIFLSFIANTEPLTPIASRFDISISSTFRVIRRVIAWLVTKIDHAIKWPQTQVDMNTTCQAFEDKTRISNVVGVIDCTHIRIEKPKRNPRDYMNNKGYFSIILQATVDSRLRFTNVYCGEPGSANCNRVLKRSPLFSMVSQNKHALFPHNTFLIGHSAYPPLTWLVPPFREGKRLTPHQRQFNTLHLSARKMSDKAFNLLRGRFRRIKLFSVYRNIAFITDTIVAACILHNYCIDENDHMEQQENEPIDEQ